MKESPVHGGHARENGDVLFLHQAQGRIWTKARQQHQGSPIVDACVHLHGLPKRVEQRQGDQVHIVVGSGVHVIGEAGVEEHIQVGQFCPLGLARRPAGIENDGGIFRTRRDRLEGRWLVTHQHAQCGCAWDGGWGVGLIGHQEEVLAAFHLLESGVTQLTDGKLRRAFLAEIGLCISIGQVIGDFTRLEQDIQRQDRRSGFEDPIVCDHERRDVLATEGNLLPYLDACLDQPMSHLACGRVQLRIRQSRFLADNGNAIGHFPRAVFEEHSKV